MGRTPKTSPRAGEVDGRRPAGEGRAATSQASPAPLSRPAPQADLSRARRGEGGAGRILVAEFGRAHGLKGEVRLKSFTADPRAVASYGPLATGDGRGLTLRSVRPAPGGAPDLLIAQVEGVTGREAAEALNRVRLFVDREKLAPPEDEDEFLLADLIGLAVLSPAGEPVGAVVGVPNYGGGDLLEIAPAKGGPSALLPFTKAFVPAVDIPGRRIVVDPPEDLFEPARPEPGDAA